jgi:cytoskeleton protein RodZ
VDDGIGSTLREARNRRNVDLSEVEAATKIRPRYLLAMENEEWDALPGGPYTRAFIRTYAGYLGLDGERLVDDYRRAFSGEGEGAPRPEPPGPVGPLRPRVQMRFPSGRAAAVVVSLALVAVLIAVGLAGEGGGGSPVPRPAARKARHAHRNDRFREVAARPGVSVKLAATAEVWVCLLDAAGEPLIDGQILEAGAEEGPYRSHRFTVSLGNGEVEMRVDGRRAAIPASSSPIGYAIESGGGLKPLADAERPTCT